MQDAGGMRTVPSSTIDDIPALVSAWAEAMADIRSLVGDLDDRRWRGPSLLPGWTVADIVAHLSWVERALLGRSDPPHEPDWAALPHAASPIARITEVPVDLRRRWSREQVLAEFDATIAERGAALRAGPSDPDTPALDPFGRPATLGGVLRMRTFDTWVHGQDIRLTIGRPGATDTSAAQVAGEQIAGALGFVWARKVDAPVGTTLVVEVTPPGVTLTRAVTRGEDGRGVDVPPPRDPTVTLTLDFDDFVQLGCGRSRPDSSPDMARVRVRIAGDSELGERTLAQLNIAP
jgi:uncharacterized protein (TIGR03083 family)